MELLCKAISLLCSLAASIEMAFKAFKFRADAEFIFEEMIDISLFAFKFMLPLFVNSDEEVRFNFDKECISIDLLSPPKPFLLV
ncbi:hypothetical protein UNSW2_526 [Campylobacter concisus UNSW2]|uniref:Uncharacterized protein n=1 Tax=Campylobacter concisus UNSW2 TaxID=1242965 RepID=U2H1Z6_9BACT|nr:hypothetical protein UNSW2_526 [Campylobacter concisus UNSW2]